MGIGWVDPTILISALAAVSAPKKPHRHVATDMVLGQGGV